MCSLSEGEARRASNDQATSVTLPLWKRVQLDDEQSTSRIYQLLQAGSTQPEALDRVTEIVVKLKENPAMCFFPMKNEHSASCIEREETRRVKPDHPIRDVVAILNLSSDGTEGAREGRETAEDPDLARS